MSSEVRIAIVGMGGLFPGSGATVATPEQFWLNVLQGTDTSCEVPAGRWVLDADECFDPRVAVADHVYSKRGYFLGAFRADLAGMDVPADFLAQLDPVFHLTLHAGGRAWASAQTDKIDRQRVGVILGNIALPTEKASALAREYLGRTFAEKVLGETVRGEATAPLNRYVAGLPAGVLARALGLGGGSFTLDAACASSLYALKLAADELRAGRADAMLAGGVSRPDCLYTQMGFAQLRALSTTGRCFPFDARASGLVVGEGSGIFLLKRLDDAVSNGDHILAVIAGVGLSNDVGGSLLAPSSEGQLRAMRAAYRAAGWSPGDVDHIECHATGTLVGDAVEFQSLQKLWEGESSPQRRCVIGSVKSTVGHLLTAAGAAGVVKVLSAMAAAKLPPTANFVAAAPHLDLARSPFQVLKQAADWERRTPQTPRRAAVSSFGFGGINAHLLLEEWDDAHTSTPLHPHTPTASRIVFEPQGQAVPIAIIGRDAHFGPWASLRAVQERMLGGGDPVDPKVPRHWWGVSKSNWFRDEGLRASQFAGYFIEEVEVVAERFRIPPRELQEMLPQQLLMLQVAANALAPAAWTDQARERTGVFIGLGLDLNTTNFSFRWSLQNEAKRWAARKGWTLTDAQRSAWVQALRDAAGPALNANRTMGALGSIVASRIARAFHFGGPSFTIASEESSGVRALEIAVRALQRGELDQALVGAVDLAGDVRAVLATHRQRPFSAAACSRPFDALADGTVIGEGAAAVVLKRLDDAVRDGDTVHAVIRGIGVAGGGAGQSLIPDEAAYRLALERAYGEAGVEPASVAFLEAHGSGLPDEDCMEARALAGFFGTNVTERPLTLASAKADIGHTGAASGLASLIKACACLEQQYLPPLRNLERPRAEMGMGLELPRSPRFWLRDRIDGPRRAALSAFSVDGNCTHVVLESAPPTAAKAKTAALAPLGARTEYLFIVEGHDEHALCDGLHQLRDQAVGSADEYLTRLARAWHADHPLDCERRLAVALVARSRAELLELLTNARAILLKDAQQPLPAPGTTASGRDRVFYTPTPLGRAGQIAFVFPGSGNDFAGMGQNLAATFPHVLRRQDAENDRLRSQYVADRFWTEEPGDLGTPRERIFAQVALGSLVSDLLRSFGVQPRAALGYSLGESAALFALRAWTGRDRMLRNMNVSTLFAGDLTPPYDAARHAWKLDDKEAVDWVSGVVDCGPDAVRTALIGVERVYLLIVNTPAECVVGGQRTSVIEVVRKLGCKFLALGDSTSVHCPVTRVVAEAYRELHSLPTQAPPDVRFYSTALGHAYDLTQDSAAEAVLAQALDTVDFPAVIDAAHREGVRLFVEVGPGASCSRMIGAILGSRPHRARSACLAGADGVGTVLRVLAQLAVERVPLDLQLLFGDVEEEMPPSKNTVRVKVGGEPFQVPLSPSAPLSAPARGVGVRAPAPLPPTPLYQDLRSGSIAPATLSPVIAQTLSAQDAYTQAHGAYLRFNQAVDRLVQDNIAFQTAVLERLVATPQAAAWVTPGLDSPAYQQGVPRALTREQCLEFAIGSISAVLGPDFAQVDAYPTRVRLPDEPLMLVDRIMDVEGEPRSMSHGRVVTEHDIHPGAWYLDGGHIPTCIAVEAGQADLFLSAYLGIDLETRGLAVYRLLDAVVTFHRALPGPGAVIRYDIHIDRFFRQGDTHLFRFRFEGTVNGEPLLTMTNGCAGFFTAEALAQGKGVVQTALDRRQQPSVEPDDATALPPLGVDRFGDAQINALRAGDLAVCFGPLFAGRKLAEALRLPGGRMKLVDRVVHLDPRGGRFGIGLIRGEADIHPGDWFLTCHFIDDRVMPGTLMYECCLHTLRIYLLRLGWIEGDAWEPVPGVASQLKCRGQVTETTQKVTYEVVLKERGYRPEPYAICDALMYADGKPIVEITNLSLRLTGGSREAVQGVWEQLAKPQAAHALYEYDRILAFAVGKPSVAFGERYRVFDEERFIARLPGPPYQFLDRIVRADAEPWKMVAGGVIEAQYDVPGDAWYFDADRADVMPYAVLLEIALQPCGWFAGYMGSALTSNEALCFRNLGGTAGPVTPVRRDAGTLSTRVRVTKVAHSGGMIIQHYDFAVRSVQGTIYEGTTTFGFFSPAALRQQVGVREAKLYEPDAAEQARGKSFDYPRTPPFPGDQMRMLDRIDLFVPDGGPAGLGFLQGSKEVDPQAWFFKAHFYQDPVWPGSLGLEAFLQLLKVAAREYWPDADLPTFRAMAGPTHTWVYRGQVIPTSRRVQVQAVVTARDDAARQLTADGFLLVDGLVIYQMKDFTLRMD